MGIFKKKKPKDGYGLINPDGDDKNYSKPFGSKVPGTPSLAAMNNYVQQSYGNAISSSLNNTIPAYAPHPINPYITTPPGLYGPQVLVIVLRYDVRSEYTTVMGLFTNRDTAEEFVEAQVIEDEEGIYEWDYTTQTVDEHVIPKEEEPAVRTFEDAQRSYEEAMKKLSAMPMNYDPNQQPHITHNIGGSTWMSSSP